MVTTANGMNKPRWKRWLWRMVASIALGGTAGLASITGFYNWYQEATPPTLEEAFPTGEIRIGVDASFAPFAIDNGTQVYGLDIDIGNALGEATGLPVRFVTMGYDGLYDALQTGRVDVLISALLFNPARTRDVRYTHHYFDNGLVLVDEPDTAIATMRDLPGYTLAFEFGSIANAEARRWERRLEPFQQNPYELPQYALDAVRLGDADAALVNNTSYQLYKNQYPDWATDAVPVTNAFIAAAVRVDREATYNWVNAIIRNMANDGRLQTIVDRWL